MSFIARLQRVREILAQQGRLSTRALERELEIGGEDLDEIIEELVDVQQVARREGKILVWVEIAAATGALLDHADARLALAAALRAAGRGHDADAEERRAIELWEAKGATLLVERTRKGRARVAPLPAESEPRVGRVPAARRDVRSNAATAMQAIFDAALAAGDFEAFAAEIGPDFEEISHPTGATYGREVMLRSVESFLRLPDATARHELLATLADRLWLLRRWMGASAAGRTSFDVGEFEKEEIGVHEVDEYGLALHNETFAADRLGNALVRLYERYGEMLPEGTGRTRFAGIARSLAAFNGPVDLDRLRAAYDPSFQNCDRRVFGTWSVGDAEEMLLHFRLQLDLAPDFAGRFEDVFAANADALVVCMTFFGTARASGGRFENHLIALFKFGVDGRVTHNDVFEAEQVAEALTRAAAGAGHGAGAATHWFENAAARTDRELFERFNARDWAGVEALAAPDLVFDERRRMLHNTCGRDVWREQFRVLYDVPASRFTTKLLGTRGERLSLSLHQFAGEVAGGGGPLEMDDHLVLHEVNGEGRLVTIVLFDLED